jgi:4-azaleucine resistance transporter AzlC
MHASFSRSAFVAGARAIAPILVSVAPFGLISGVTAVGVGLSDALAFGMSFLIFAGASQLAVVQLIGDGAVALAIITTAALINLRFVMYSASLAPHFRRLPLAWKCLLAYVLTDQAYAVSITHYMQDDPDEAAKHWYFLGTALPLWVTWQISTAVGIFVGAQVPPEWSLDFAIPLNFLALLIPAIKGRTTVVAAVVAGVVAVAAFHVPFNLGLMIGALSGVLVGLLVDIRLRGEAGA